MALPSAPRRLPHDSTYNVSRHCRDCIRWSLAAHPLFTQIRRNFDVDVLALRVGLAGELRLDAEGVGTEVVTLGLQDVGREVLGAEAVVEGKGGGEGRSRDTPESALGDDVTPAGLSLLDSLVEEVGKQQVLKVWVGTVGSSDVLQEDGADDAATTPHEGNLRLLELPAVLLSSLWSQLASCLRRGMFMPKYLRVKSLLKVVQDFLPVAREAWGRAGEPLRSPDTLALQRRQAACKDSLANESHWLAHVQSVDGSPLAGTLLASSVEDLLHERSAVLVVVVHDVTGDLNEEGVKHALVPLSKDVANLLAAHAETALHDVVGLKYVSIDRLRQDSVYAYLRDKLHVTVLNAVVHHLDVVTSTLVTDPLTAGLAVGLGGDALEDVLDVWPSLLVTTWHDGWAVTGTLLTTGDTGTDKADALLLQELGATVGVREVRVTAIDDDVARLSASGQDGLDEVVNRLASHDEHHHTSRLLELGDEVLQALCANNALALGLVVKEAVDLGDGTVEGDDVEAVVSGVHDQVLAHDRQANETKVSAVEGLLLAI
ncbi:6-phosphogluconate dehydrogenase, decarboxylating [Hortaea werneckii]|nr:6-phosphogluconate dehydrogenase, decarboxylating [Hortaea werneckii]